MRTTTPWSNRFAKEFTDAELCAALRIRAFPILQLLTYRAEEAASHLRSALEKVFVPTGQVLRVIRQLTEVAIAYCDLAYADEVAVLRRIYHPEDRSLLAAFPAICLMGHAGTGKSAILAAFARLHSGRTCVALPNHSEFELRSCWSLRLRDRATLSDLVFPQFRVAPEKAVNRMASILATRELAEQGVALLLADEFQFITGSEANVLAAKLLLQLSELGPPLIYACNFSLVSRLWKRPPQERDRILVSPIVLQPEANDSDWTAVVVEYAQAAPELSQLGAEQVAHTLHGYCFGIKRALRELLVRSYLEMRRTNDSFVNTGHIEQAYTSPGFASMRRDIERIAAEAINPSNSKDALNYRPPFKVVTQARQGTAAHQHPAISQYEERAAQAALASLVSPVAKEVVELLSDRPVGGQPKRSRAKRPPVTAQNLIGGAERFAKGE